MKSVEKLALILIGLWMVGILSVPLQGKGERSAAADAASGTAEL